TQAFVGDLPDLRRVEAVPDLLDLRACAPEVEELAEVARAIQLLPRHGAVNGDLVTNDVFQDSIVGRRRAPRVVVGLKAVNRNDEGQTMEATPLLRDFTDGARDELGVNTALGELRQNHAELPIAHQRLPADDRDVQRPMLIDDGQELVDQLLAREIANL